jgi:hypothetical protein
VGGKFVISDERRQAWTRAFRIDPSGSSSIKPDTAMEKAADEEKLKLLPAGLKQWR